MPLTVWKLQLAVGVIVVPLLEGLLAWLLIGSAASLYPDAWKVFSGAARRVWRRDALVALVLSLAAGAGLARVDALLTSVFHAYAPINDELFPATFSTHWPAAGFFLSHLTRTLLLCSAGGLGHLHRPHRLETAGVVAVGGVGAGSGFTGTHPRALARGVRRRLGDESAPPVGGALGGGILPSR